MLKRFFRILIAALTALSPALPFEISKLGSGLSAVMIVGCAVIVFDLENREKRSGKETPNERIGDAI